MAVSVSVDPAAGAPQPELIRRPPRRGMSPRLCRLGWLELEVSLDLSFFGPSISKSARKRPKEQGHDRAGLFAVL